MMEFCRSDILCLWFLLVICWCSSATVHAEDQSSAMMLKEVKEISRKLSVLIDIERGGLDRGVKMSKGGKDGQTNVIPALVPEKARETKVKVGKRRTPIGLHSGLKFDQIRRQTTEKRTSSPDKMSSASPDKVQKTSSIVKTEETSSSFTLKDKLTIYRLNEYGVPIDEDLPLLLTTNVCHGIIVTFMKEYRDSKHRYMSIWVGVGGLTKIFDCVDHPSGSCTSKAVVSDRRRVWNCQDSTVIWLKWTNMGYVSAGTGKIPGQNVLVEYQGKKQNTPVNYIGIISLEDTNVKCTAKSVGSLCKDSTVGNRREDEGMVAFTLKHKMTVYHANDYGVSISPYKSLVMKVKACKGMVVTFMKYYKDDKNRYLSIWLGVNGKTKIYDCVNKSPGLCTTKPVDQFSGKVWRCKDYTDLWFQWSNTGFVSAGKGLTLGKDALVKYQGPKKMTPVNYIGIVPLEETNVNVKMKPVCGT